MSDQAAISNTAGLLSAVAPLRNIDPSERAAAPPQRLPIDSALECLVQWGPDSGGNDWTLLLYARPRDIADTETPVARLALHVPSGDAEPTANWENADNAFRDWAESHLPQIAAEIAAMQPAEQQETRRVAGLSNGIGQKLGQMMPHLVVLGGLAAFAYMFGVVHIK